MTQETRKTADLPRFAAARDGAAIADAIPTADTLSTAEMHRILREARVLRGQEFARLVSKLWRRRARSGPSLASRA